MTPPKYCIYHILFWISLPLTTIYLIPYSVDAYTYQYPQKNTIQTNLLHELSHHRLPMNIKAPVGLAPEAPGKGVFWKLLLAAHFPCSRNYEGNVQVTHRGKPIPFMTSICSIRARVGQSLYHSLKGRQAVPHGQFNTYL